MFTASPLVVSDAGTGFFDADRNEVRGAFMTHCRPNAVRPATAEEARAFFQHRLETRRELVAYYARPGYKGD